MTGIALHTWSLDTTPLPRLLAAARAAGWDAVEFRWSDVERARAGGGTEDDVLQPLEAGGLPVACVGAPAGWMFADGPRRGALLDAFAACCRWARRLGTDLVMSPADFGRGAVARAAVAVREIGDIAAEHGVRVAIEPCSQAEQLNRLEPLREILAAAGVARCGLLVDTYHVQRSGDWPAVETLAGREIFHVQYSDVPAEVQPGFVLDRLPPGQGVVPFRQVFALLAARGYAGYLSYEAPNPVAWARDPFEVAREAAAATRARLPGRGPSATTAGA